MNDRVRCDRCWDAGIDKPSDVMYDTRRIRNLSPLRSIAESIPRPVKGRRYLCFEHLDILPDEIRDQYVPVEVGKLLDLAKR